MSVSILDGLLGQNLILVRKVHDYVQLQFGNGDLLNVFNEFSIEGGCGSELVDLMGLNVNAVTIAHDEVCLKLGKAVLRVSLREEAFSGPEAVEYIPATGSRIVWS